MKLSARQREVLTDLATKTHPVKIGMHTGWNTRTMETLQRLGLVTLEMRHHHETRPGCRVESFVSDGTFATITAAGRAAVGT